MSIITYPAGVKLKSPILSAVDALTAIAAGGRPCVPGLPDELVVVSVSERAIGVESRGFANAACRQQFVWEMKERLGTLYDVFLEGEGTPREQFTIKRKAGA